MRIYGSREPTDTGPNDNKTNFIKRAKIINRLKPEGERARPPASPVLFRSPSCAALDV